MTVELSSTQGLNLWCDPSVDSSRKEATDLTSHQLALFLKVYLTPQPQAMGGAPGVTASSARRCNREP